MEQLFRFKKPLSINLPQQTIYKYYPELSVYYPLNEIGEPIYYLGIHSDYVQSLKNNLDYIYITNDNVEVKYGDIVINDEGELIRVDKSMLHYSCYSIEYYLNRHITFLVEKLGTTVEEKRNILNLILKICSM